MMNDNPPMPIAIPMDVSQEKDKEISGTLPSNEKDDNMNMNIEGGSSQEATAGNQEAAPAGSSAVSPPLQTEIKAQPAALPAVAINSEPAVNSDMPSPPHEFLSLKPDDENGVEKMPSNRPPKDATEGSTNTKGDGANNVEPTTEQSTEFAAIDSSEDRQDATQTTSSTNSAVLTGQDRSLEPAMTTTKSQQGADSKQKMVSPEEKKEPVKSNSGGQVRVNAKVPATKDSEDLLISDETLPPYDFGGLPISFFLGKFTWASLGMDAYLKSLAISREHQLKHPTTTSTSTTGATFKKSKQKSPKRKGDKHHRQMPPHLLKDRPNGNNSNKQARVHTSSNEQHLNGTYGAHPPPHKSRHPGHPSQTAPPAGSRPKSSSSSSKLPRRQTFPSAAAKPIRRLAKIRPYSNQAIPVSAEEIFDAIPREATSVFHVMDRRVNLDAFAPVVTTDQGLAVPVYSLLRAWVQDDPCRQVPTHQQSQLTSSIMGTSSSAAPAAPAVKRKRDDSILTASYKDNGEGGGKKRKSIADVIGYIAKSKSQSSGAPMTKDDLKKDLVQSRAKKKKRGASSKREFAQILDRLRKREIDRFGGC